MPSIPPHFFFELLWCYWSQTGAAPLILRHDERNTGAKKMAAPLILRHRKLHLGANSSIFTMWSGGASLHRVEEHLSGLWGWFFACSLFARPSLAVSPRPGLVKLLALSNFPAYVHFVDRVSQDITASVVLHVWMLFVIGASFSYDRMHLWSQVSRTQWLLCADPPFTLCTIDDATPEWISSVSDALFLRGLICFRICLINSFIVLANDCERFCCFSRTWNCPFRIVVADWRANRPGHVP